MSVMTIDERRVRYSDTAMQTADELLHGGAGFVIVGGVPADPNDIATTQALAIRLMSHFGSLAEQDDEGTTAYLIRDEGVSLGYGKFGDRRVNPGVRSSKSNDRLRFHNDSGARWAGDVVDVLGTLMISDGVSGGDVLIVDGRVAYERLMESNPGAVDRLKRPFAFDTETRVGRDGLPFSWGPIIYDHRGHFELRVSLSRVEMASDFLGTPLTPEDFAAMDALQATFEDPALITRIHLTPGDLLLIDDRRMVHSRGAFEDGAGEANRRCLVRLWAQRPKQPLSA